MPCGAQQHTHLWSPELSALGCPLCGLCGPFCHGRLTTDYLLSRLIDCQALPSMEAASNSGQGWVMRRLVSQLQAVLELVPAHWWVEWGLEGAGCKSWCPRANISLLVGKVPGLRVLLGLVFTCCWVRQCNVASAGPLVVGVTSQDLWLWGSQSCCWPHWWVRPGPSVNAASLVGKASSWCVCLQGPGSGIWCLPDGEWSSSWAPLMARAKFLGGWELKGVDGI